MRSFRLNIGNYLYNNKIFQSETEGFGLSAWSTHKITSSNSTDRIKLALQFSKSAIPVLPILQYTDCILRFKVNHLLGSSFLSFGSSQVSFLLCHHYLPINKHLKITLHIIAKWVFLSRFSYYEQNIKFYYTM